MVIYICQKSIKKYKRIINPQFKTADSSSVTGGAVTEVRGTQGSANTGLIMFLAAA